MHVLMGFIKRPLALYKTSKQSETITFACKKLYVSLWNNINNIIDPQASTDEYVQYVVNRITNQQARFLPEWYTGILLENVTNDAIAT